MGDESERVRKRMRQKDNIERFFFYKESFDAGIVPIEYSHANVNNFLRTLPEDQVITMKRKFRKMWRKALKDKAMSGVADPQSLEAWYGSPGKMPTANQKNNRKALVKAKITQKVLEDVKRLRDGIV
jgi:hypothetical protein